LEAFESFAVVGGSGSVVAELAEGGPGEYVFCRVLDGEDELGEQAPDLVARQRDQAVLVTVLGGAPFMISAARTMLKNAAAAMARVMWAYQAS
jgi:hypothetical protein